jgi:hypothetical protein
MYVMNARYMKKSGSSKFCRFEIRTATRERTKVDVKTNMATFVRMSSSLVMGVFGRGLPDDMFMPSKSNV